MLSPGDLVGPYEIRGFLGQGGMGKVYRAFDPRLERTVALKVIGLSGAGTDEAMGSGLSDGARLLREARAVASLSHPNVVAIYDVGEHESLLYLAMEYVVGSPLRALIGTSHAPLARRLRWMIDVARALDVAHGRGIVHRDIKPENVMIREDDAVKVLDFGIARRTLATGSEDQQAVDTVTGGGSIAGTPVYMAPEQIRGHNVDARCDQFAWAVMAYELLCGQRPWRESGDVLALVATILTDPVPPLRARAPDVPQAVEETILRALAKDPKARFPAMSHVADALEAFAAPAHAGGGVRIAVASGSREDPTAFAATTRVPTPAASADEGSTDAPPPARTLPRGARLALPLFLLGALAVTTTLVLRRHPTHEGGDGGATATPRPLSIVPEAEAVYKEAMSLWHDGAKAKSTAALKRATELDPSFAAAHLELALQTSAEDPAFGQAEFQSAFEHRQWLIARDAALLEASEPYVRPKPDLGEWETRITAAVFQFPRDPELQYYLGRARERQTDDEGAKAAYDASVRLDPAFIPGLAALASADRNLGRAKDALSHTERCLKQSPVATICLEVRVALFADTGECSRAKSEAAQWGVVEPQSPAPFAMLARALHAEGAPRPAVEEALSRRWELLSTEHRARGETWDRVHLAILDGDLARAEQLAREYGERLPRDADAYDHAEPALARVNFLLELDRIKEAAAVARDYLDRLPAWTPYPFAADPSILFYEPLVRAGDLKKARLDEERHRWLASEQARLHGDGATGQSDWQAWSLAWGSFVETRAEATEALARAPLGDLPRGARRPLSLDFNLGKSFALAGRESAAIQHLARVTATCSSFDDAMLVRRAHYYTGIAHEAAGRVTEARGSYEKSLADWPKTPSRTVSAAGQRLRALAR